MQLVNDSSVYWNKNDLHEHIKHKLVGISGVKCDCDKWFRNDVVFKNVDAVDSIILR